MGIGILFLVIGLAMVASVVWYGRRGNARYAAATSSWTRAEAQIDSAACDYHEDRSDNSSGGGWRARVAYSYPVGERTLQGTRPFLHARRDFSAQKQADEWLAHHAAGSAVPVWFDPARPEDSALELNKPSLLVILIVGGLGAALTAFGLLMLIAGPS